VLSGQTLGATRSTRISIERVKNDQHKGDAEVMDTIISRIVTG